MQVEAAGNIVAAERIAPDGDLASDSVVVTTWTAVSRVTGLLKIAVIAGVLGPTFLGNVFQAANLLPNAVFEFLTGSLLANVLVPPLVRHLRRGRDAELARLAGGFLGLLTVGLGVVTAALVLARPVLLRLFTAVVPDHGIATAQQRVGSLLLLLILPQIVLYGYAGVAGAALNAKGRLGLPAAGPAVENLTLIAALGYCWWRFGTGVEVQHAPSALVLTLGIGATVAVAAHALVLLAGCFRSGIVLIPRFRWDDDDARQLVRDLVPTIGQAGLNASRSLFALVAGNVIGGGVVAFQFALTFFYLPPALSAKSVGVAMLRRLAFLHDGGARDRFRDEMRHGVALTAFLTIPAAVGYAVFAHPLIASASFGEMSSPRAIAYAAAALIGLAPGVVGEGAFLLGTYGSYAAGDAHTPFRSTLIRTVVVIGGMVAAMTTLRGVALLAALGIAVSVGNLVGTVHLHRALRPSIDPFNRSGEPVRRAAIASVAMAAAMWSLYAVASRLVSGHMLKTLMFVMSGAVGCAFYLRVQQALGSPERDAFMSSLRSGVRIRTQRPTVPHEQRGPRRSVPVLGALLVVGVAGLAAGLSPIYAVLAICALGLAGLVFWRPRYAAYILLGATPILVGFNRGSVIPFLRPHEALVGFLALVVGARAVLSRFAYGDPILPPRRRVDAAVLALVITGSLLPVLWLMARGHAVVLDDLLYALVLWKYAITYLVIRMTIRSPSEVMTCLWVSIVSASILAVVGIAQAIGVTPVRTMLTRFYPPDGLTAVVADNRASATIGNPIAFADVMAIHLALAGGWLLRGGRPRLLLGGSAALFCLGALASGQFSGLLALAVAATVLAALTGQVKRLAAAGAVIAVVAALALQPVIRERIDHLDPSTHIPQSWVARGQNLKTYFLPELASPEQAVLGVRPAARVPANESWRDWVYIESGWVWLLWTGGIPFVLAFFWYLGRGVIDTRRQARRRHDAVGVAAIGACAALAVVGVLMPLDPHLTMRGSADAAFAILALAMTAIGTGWRTYRAQKALPPGAGMYRALPSGADR